MWSQDYTILQCVCSISDQMIREKRLKLLNVFFRNIEEFAMCQWNNSVGCLFFEQLAQNYLGSLTPVFDRCAIALPQRALRQGPGKTGKDLDQMLMQALSGGE